MKCIKNRSKESKIRLVAKATLKCIDELGTSGLSLSKISQESGVPMSTIRRLFPNNDDIILHIIENHFLMFERCVQSIRDNRELLHTEKIIAIELVTFYMSKFSDTKLSPTFFVGMCHKSNDRYDSVKRCVGRINTIKQEIFAQALADGSLNSTLGAIEKTRARCLVIQRGATFVSCQGFTDAPTIEDIYTMLGHEVLTLHWCSRESAPSFRNVHFSLKQMKDRMEVLYF